MHSGLLCLSLMENGLSKLTPEDIWQDAMAVLDLHLLIWHLFMQKIPLLKAGLLGL
jgi:hypothetical protein